MFFLNILHNENMIMNMKTKLTGIMFASRWGRLSTDTCLFTALIKLKTQLYMLLKTVPSCLRSEGRDVTGLPKLSFRESFSLKATIVLFATEALRCSESRWHRRDGSVSLTTVHSVSGSHSLLLLDACCFIVAAALERDVTPLEHLGGRSNMASGVVRCSVSVGGACMNINEFQLALLDSRQV